MFKQYKVFLLILFSIFFTSCFKNDSNLSLINSSNNKKVSLVVHGIIKDQGLHESAFSGLESANSHLGYEISYQGIDKVSDFNSYLENIYNLQNDLILSVDFTLWEAMYEQALSHADQKYVIIDYTEIEKPLENLLTVGFRSQEGSFLAGYLAARMSQTGKIGFIGGVKGTIIDMFDYGYEAGAKYANQDIIILNKYSEDFNNPPLGKTIASYMYQNGADIIFHAAGATGIGVIEAAKEFKNNSNQNIWVIGVDDDQSPLGPEVVLTSVLKRVDNVIYSLLEKYNEGIFNGGFTLELGLEDQSLELTYSPYLSQDLREELEDISQKIISGDIKIPYNQKTRNDF